MSTRLSLVDTTHRWFYYIQDCYLLIWRNSNDDFQNIFFLVKLLSRHHHHYSKNNLTLYPQTTLLLQITRNQNRISKYKAKNSSLWASLHLSLQYIYLQVTIAQESYFTVMIIRLSSVSHSYVHLKQLRP